MISRFFVLLTVSGLLIPTDSEVRASGPPERNKAVPELLKGFDQEVERVMRAWHIPGIAIGVVHDGKVIYVKAYGQRDLEKKLPVTTETLFPIGSITKSFTATGLGMLVDDGVLDLDAPIRGYLPEFRLRDELAGARPRGGTIIRGA